MADSIELKDALHLPKIDHKSSAGDAKGQLEFGLMPFQYAYALITQLQASAVAGLLGGARVKKHRWTLHGLKLGNPVYVLGQTKPRSRDELAAEGLDGTLGNSIIDVWGNEDAPGVKCTLQRGTELANLGRSRSGFELIMLPIVMMIGGIALIGLA